MNKKPQTPAFSQIDIIFNPKSTGAAPSKAKALQNKLQKKLPDKAVNLCQTKHAGHAETLAFDIARRAKNPLIISVSGDGGYHEVINGAMQATQKHKAQPVCAVYAAGNANDHHRTLKQQPLTKAIATEQIQKIDLLKAIIMTKKGQKTIRYAHSYIGLGITPAVAVELNKHELNRWRESLLLAKTFLKFEPFYIEIEGKHKQFDSLIFANINQMAKVIKLSKGGRPDDGHFEVIELPHKRRVDLLAASVKAAVLGLGSQPRRKSCTFNVAKKLPMQLDGELIQLPSGAQVEISIAVQGLRTLL